MSDRFIGNFRLVACVIAAAGAVSLSGCAATQVALEHKNLDVQTKMSKTIFLTPVPPSEQTVYVQFKNTSDKTMDVSTLEQEIDASLANQGYHVVPYNQAHYLLQINIRSVGKSSPSAAQEALGGGYGGTVASAIAGSAVGGVIGQSPEAAGIGGIVAGVGGFVADSVVKKVTYAMVTDVQIGERSKAVVNQQTNANLQQGTSTTTSQQTSSSGHWIYYRTRIVSTANKVNLDFKTALPTLQGQLVHSLSGII